MTTITMMATIVQPQSAVVRGLPPPDELERRELLEPQLQLLLEPRERPELLEPPKKPPPPERDPPPKKLRELPPLLRKPPPPPLREPPLLLPPLALPMQAEYGALLQAADGTRDCACGMPGPSSRCSARIIASAFARQ